MCATCGCGEGDVTLDGRPVHDHRDHRHPHRPAHGHDHAHHDHPHHHHAPAGSRTVAVERDILEKNDRFADDNRAFLAARRILALNLVSGPGAGKTSLLVRTIADLAGRVPIAVVEGDQATDNDATRIRATGAPAVQINTGRGCHLDAHMVGHAIGQLDPAPGSVLVIENVGNLVCPAAFDLGETERVVLFSVTDGEDKPLKYPDLFASSGLVLLTKVDLLPHLDFDVGRALAAVKAVNRRAKVLRLSARTGEGLDAWYGWLTASLAREAA